MLIKNYLKSRLKLVKFVRSCKAVPKSKNVIIRIKLIKKYIFSIGMKVKILLLKFLLLPLAPASAILLSLIYKIVISNI